MTHATFALGACGHDVFSETLNTAGETPALPRAKRFLQGSATVLGRWPRRLAEAFVLARALQVKPLHRVNLEPEDVECLRPCSHDVFSETLNTAGETPALPRAKRFLQGSATVLGRWPRRLAEAFVLVGAVRFQLFQKLNLEPGNLESLGKYSHNVFSETLNTAGGTPALPRQKRQSPGGFSTPKP